MAKALIWMAFDFTTVSDYDQIYAWLDNHHANECINDMAVLPYEYENDLIETLKKDLSESVTFNKRARVYIIYRDAEKIKGKFIFGCRQEAPWIGFCQAPGPDDEELSIEQA